MASCRHSRAGWEGDPPRAGRMEGRGPPIGAAVLLTLSTKGATIAGARRYTSAGRKLSTATGPGRRSF